MLPEEWPVLTRYADKHLAKIALPLGGIGTGTVSLGGRGDLRDFEVVNRPAKGFTPGNTFFALRVARPDGSAVTRCLEGPLDLSLYEGGFGSPAPNHGLPRFEQAAFEAAYPLGQVVLSDSAVPLTVRIQAFNPLIPADSERSGIPVAILRFCLTNTTTEPLTVSVCGTLPNFIGNDGKNSLAKDNRNSFRESDGLAGVFLFSEGVPADAETAGTMALSLMVPPADARPDSWEVTHRTAWKTMAWNTGLLDFWDDFSGDGLLTQEDGPTCHASLSARFILPPGATEAVTYLMTWHFPHRLSWNNGPVSGNYYTTRYPDAWDVAVRTATDLPALEADTLAFVRAFCDADLPTVVKEAALYNVSTLRTQTTFRTPDGRLFGWEGCGDKDGCCHGTCTHVWNYEVTTPFLFGDLAQTMREVEFGFTTKPNGLMMFRAQLPLKGDSNLFQLAAADGQMGCLMKLYREWRLSGDEAFLRRLWPAARRSLEFCWVPGGWDADRDGVMEGCQHNTMDVEYYGPNPQMGAWYLGALRACEEMARYLGDNDFAAECHRLFEGGSAWLDDHLFNGEYYEHQIVPPGQADAIAEGLRHWDSGARNLEEPDFQLGAGCLIDQLVGQYMAHVCGLGYLLKPEHIVATLESLLRYNFRTSLRDHFNHMRSYVLGEEAAMLMATYPKGRRPRVPFPYYNEVMTGFEHQAAAHLLYEGKTGEGLMVLSAIRARYDGQKRSPFNEAECGHHYARAMAAWASVLALTGFQYDGVSERMTFALPQEPVRWFWSQGYAFGTVAITPLDTTVTVEISVLGGTLRLKEIALSGQPPITLEAPVVLNRADSLAQLHFPRTVAVP